MSLTPQAAAPWRSRRVLLAMLRRVESYLDSCSQSQPAACYIRDFQSNQHFWSPEAFHWFGLPVAEQAPSMDQFFALIVAQQRSEMRAAVRRHVEDGGRFVYEYRVRPRRGTVKHLRSIGQTIPSRAGHGTAIMGALVDLTEHEHAQAALRKAFKILLQLDPGEGLAPCFPRNFPEVAGHGIDRRSADQDVNVDVETECFAAVSGGLSARQFGRVCRLMRTRLRERLGVREMASAAGLSAAHFARAFKQTTGLSPHRFILEQRLDCARWALAHHSGGKLASVAIDFGFFDQSHFTRHFRRKFGVTPADFLRQSVSLPTPRWNTEPKQT